MGCFAIIFGYDDVCFNDFLFPSISFYAFYKILGVKFHIDLFESPMPVAVSASSFSAMKLLELFFKWKLSVVTAVTAFLLLSFSPKDIFLYRV